MFECRGRWLYCGDQQTLAAMIEAVSMRADIKEICTATN
jgi:hypothetical protein